MRTTRAAGTFKGVVLAATGRAIATALLPGLIARRIVGLTAARTLRRLRAVLASLRTVHSASALALPGSAISRLVASLMRGRSGGRTLARGITSGFRPRLTLIEVVQIASGVGATGLIARLARRIAGLLVVACGRIHATALHRFAGAGTGLRT